MEEEWNWKVSAMAALRKRADDRMEERNVTPESEDEKVKGKEEMMDWRLPGEVSARGGRGLSNSILHLVVKCLGRYNEIILAIGRKSKQWGELCLTFSVAKYNSLRGRVYVSN